MPTSPIGMTVHPLKLEGKAEQLQPSVIFMEAQMPKMDGIEATRYIKQRLPNVKVPVLTMHTGYIDEALAGGAEGYLLTHSGREELVRAIKKLGHWA